MKRKRKDIFHYEKRSSNLNTPNTLHYTFVTYLLYIKHHNLFILHTKNTRISRNFLKERN